MKNEGRVSQAFLSGIWQLEGLLVCRARGCGAEGYAQENPRDVQSTGVLS